MSLENIVKKGVDYAKLQFLPANKERMKDYVVKYDLDRYFSDDVSKEDKERFRRGLEEITSRTMDKYGSELEGTFRKVASKGSMALAVLNDIYAYASSVVPIFNVARLGVYLFSGKSIAEAPALIKYVRKSKDVKGAIKHVLLKPVRYLIPVVGAALESGAFERMVKKGIRKEIVREFIKRYGNYAPIEERLREKLKDRLEDSIYVPSGEREGELVAA